jgi:exonuclease III
MKFGTDNWNVNLNMDKDGDLGHINFATLNCSGISGKVHLIEKLLLDYELDFIFVCETWTVPGSLKRLFPSMIFAQEYERAHHGRAHYGQGIILNTSKTRKNDFELIFEDKDNFVTCFRLFGTRFLCSYIPPNRPGNFIEDYTTQLEEHFACNEPFIWLGDFNARSLAFGDHLSNHKEGGLSLPTG